jgi:hypothetical protein
MKYEYRATLIDRKNKIAENIKYSIDPSSWIEYMKARTDEYANLAEVVESALPELEKGNYPLAHAILRDVDTKFQKFNENAIFELMMYFWHGFKNGVFSAEIWSTILGGGWQCGSRGMLGGVNLKQDTVLEMFGASIPKLLYGAGTPLGEEDWEEYYGSLPDEMIVYRGFSTGSQLQENGFSWTTDLQEAWKFAGLNTHTKRETPGVLAAIIPKCAILAVFSFESEIVVNPTIPKLDLKTKLVTGLALRKFQKKFQIGVEGRVPGAGMF